MRSFVGDIAPDLLDYVLAGAAIAITKRKPLPFPLTVLYGPKGGSGKTTILKLVHMAATAGDPKCSLAAWVPAAAF